MALQHARRQAWRTMAWGVACFLALQLGAMHGLERRFPHLRFAEARAALARAAGAPTTVLALGSSRFGSLIDDGVATAELRRTQPNARLLNAAVACGDPLSDEYVFEALAAAGVRPRMVLIETLPESLISPNPWMRFHVPRQVAWRDTAALLPEILRGGAGGHWLETKLLPLVRFRKEIRRAALAACRAPRAAAGAAPLATPMDWEKLLDGIAPPGSDDPARLRADNGEFAKEMRGYRPGGVSKAALERLLARCRELGATPILLAPPVASTHRAVYTPEIEASFQAQLAELRTRHDFAFRDCRGLLDDRLFRDHHHGRPPASFVFGGMLARQLPEALAGATGKERR